MIRDARPGEAPAVAALHGEITTGFLPSLGQAFLTRLYRALIAWPGAHVLVADDDGRVIGFIAFIEDIGAFYKHFVVRHGVAAGIAAFPRLIRPSSIRRAWETFRYGTADSELDGQGEVLSMATAPEARGKGIGRLLMEASVDRFRELALPGMHVVIAEDNEASLAVHRRYGFEEHSTVEVHAGEVSKVLVWSP